MPCIFFELSKICHMLKILLIAFIFLLIIAIIFLIISLFRIRRIAFNRLVLIKDWLDWLYVYSDDAVSFQNRCKSLAHIKQLAKYNIINWVPPNYKMRMKWHKLSLAERRFVCLMNAGFTNRELCAIFQVGKISSIYVKYYRIKTK